MRTLVAFLLLGQVALAGEPVIVPALPSSEPPSAEATKRARAAYEAASKSFYAGRVEAALPHAMRAWEATPNASSALIVATVLAELKRPCDALPYVLLAADLEPVGNEVTLVEDLLREQAPACAPGYGWARITTQPADAVISIADVAVPGARTVAVSAGTHALRVDAPGRVAHAQDLLVAAGAPTTLTLDLAPIPAPDPDPDSDPDPDPPPARAPPQSRTLQWLTIGTGAAALIGGGVCLGLAIDEADHGDSIVAHAATPPSEDDRRALDASHARTRDFETAGWIAGGVGLTALTVGIVWLLIDDDDAPVALRLHDRTLTLEHRF